MSYRWWVAGAGLIVVAGAAAGMLAVRSPESPMLTSEAMVSTPEELAHLGHKKPEPLRFKEVHLEKAFDYYPSTGRPGVITYTLEDPGIVSIRVKKARTRELMLASIVEWEYRDAGTHTEMWDGKDYSDNIVKPSEASLIVQGEAASSIAPGTMESASSLSDEEIVHGHRWGHAHARHSEDAEEVPIIRVTSISPGDTLSGVPLITVEVDEARRGYGDEWGYGVRYYVDDVQAHEEFYKPESNGKFAYRLDTTAFEDGEHTLYVGVCDHNQHATSRGLDVVINNTSAVAR